MPPGVAKQELARIGRTVLRWRAERRLMVCATAITVCLWVFSLSDLLGRLERATRVATWLVLLTAAGLTVWWLRRTMGRRPTPQAVAATVEKAFPELDNHLINFLQFSEDRSNDPFKKAYIAQGVPGWAGLKLKEMKNRRAHRRALLALGVAVAVLLAPSALTGRAWTVAVWRIVNPFSDVQPVSLTRILAVAPGTTSLVQGDPLVMTCKVAGSRAHKVWLDVHPADGEETTYALGKLEGAPEEFFSHRIPALTAVTRYRFRAGDSPFPKWYQATPRPPLAFTTVEATVTPPDYTRAAPVTVDALGDELEIPEGAQVAIRAACNAPLESARLLLRGADPVALSADGGRAIWSGNVTIGGGTSMKLVATDTFGEKIEAQIGYRLRPDRPPVIRILAPKGRLVLEPGATPGIDFAVADDYGLTDVAVERVRPGSRTAAGGEVLKRWPLTNSMDFASIWQDEARAAADTAALAFRIVARDNCAHNPHTAKSSPILFNAADFEQMASERDRREREAFATLVKIIDLQRENIRKTTVYEKILESTTAGHWQETAGRQQEIRDLTKGLLSNPAEPLGTLTPTVKRLYMAEMAQVIGTLSRVPSERGAAKPALVARSLNMEQKILRQLTYAQVAAAQTSVQRRSSVLSSMLKALIKGETKVLKTTTQHAATAAAVGSALVDEQDDLALDLTEFVSACRRESDAIEGNDPTFGALLAETAERCEGDRIRDDMMLASDKLDSNRPRDAIPYEKQALAKLKAIGDRLNEVEVAAVAEKEEEMLEAIETAREKIRKIKALHKRAIEAMDMVKDQFDVNDEFDLMEEEYQALLKNTKQAMLQIPRDLHVFMELNVANELVEDVFSVFEEVEQAEGTEDGTAGDVQELAFAKREELLEMMEEAEGRLDDVEMWLGDKPDTRKITTESFDQEEMPEAGMALGALAAEAEDLIGDLLKESEEAAREADDGAINHAMSDDLMGWEVMEGDMASFAAKGKSGNQAPDHKEQDGRSNVGRQGMAVGETAAGSGTIHEGDKNIEERRTQDPTQGGQVDLDGEADTKATGGGKQASGKADDFGMDGGARRMDSTEAGSFEGLEALMAKRAETIYAKASLKNVRADSLKDAAHHLRQAADAIAEGRPIDQVKEFKRQAVAALRRATTQLEAGTSGALADGRSSALLDGVVQGGPDEAPPKYRDLVADYYRRLNETL